MNNELMVNNDTPEFVSFLNGTIKIYNDTMTERFKSLTPDTFEVNMGRRYIGIFKVGTQRSIHVFVDRTNGDVLKPATWRAPAKHARGNIFDPANGLGMMKWTGPEYLR